MPERAQISKNLLAGQLSLLHFTVFDLVVSDVTISMSQFLALCSLARIDGMSAFLGTPCS
jgi:hypothetical protein